jgi:hypothetical protein
LIARVRNGVAVQVPSTVRSQSVEHASLSVALALSRQLKTRSVRQTAGTASL